MKTQQISAVLALVLMIGMPCSALETFVSRTWSGTLDIPDQTVVEKYLGISVVSLTEARVTKIYYYVTVDDNGSEGNFWCSDYDIYIGNDARGHHYYQVWDNQGGQKDEGADEDTENDSDIHLYGTLDTQFDGDLVNQKWWVYVVDNKSHGIRQGLGRLVYFQVNVFYEYFIIPNVVGKNLSDAKSQITNAGFVVGTETYQCSNTIPFGHVISQIPSEGTEFVRGSKVDLLISSGVCPTTQVNVPNVVGMTLDTARSAISNAGLVVWSITYANSNTVLQGQVVSQDPAAGTDVPVGTSVNLVISSGPSGGPVGPGPGASGLVAHWKLDETEGTIAHDSSINQNHGTLSPTGTEWVSGHIDGGLNFTGTDNYVEVPNNVSLNMTNAITIAAWLNPTWTGNNRILQKTYLNNQYALFAELGISLAFDLGGVANGKLAGIALPWPGEWHHVASTYDSSAMKVYYDGDLVAQQAASGQIRTGSSPLYIGTSRPRAWGDVYQGIMDDVRLYNCALSEGEIEAMMSGTGGAETTGKIIWVSDGHQTISGAMVPDDQDWVDLLRSKGYNEDYQPPIAPATGYWRTLNAAKLEALDTADLIIISRDASSLEHANDATEVTQWNSIKTPLILLQVFLTQSSRWLWMNSQGSMGQRQAYFTAKAVDTSHPVFTGVNLNAQGQVTWLDQSVYPGYSSYINTTNAGNGHIIAVRPDNNYVVIAEWLAGTPFYAGSTQTPADKRMLFCAGTEQTPDTSVGWGVYDLTAEGQKMFLNAVAYMIDVPVEGGGITVENFSFELPGTARVKGWDGACSDPAWTGLVYDIPGWSSDSAAFDSGVETGYTPTNGIWTAFLKAGDPAVWQLTNHTIESDEVFELKVDARINWNAPTTLLMVLYYDHAGLRIPVAIQTFGLTDNMQEYTLSFTAGHAPSSIGKKIGIEFTNVSPVSDSWLGLDNVCLSLVH
jgi:beta-lactam-binding protein with PASTA domain